MSFQVVAHDPKAGFITADFTTPRAGARLTTRLAKRTGTATLYERGPGHLPIKLMTCTLRRPYEGRKYAKCTLTAAGETYLRGKR